GATSPKCRGGRGTSRRRARRSARGRPSGTRPGMTGSAGRAGTRGVRLRRAGSSSRGEDLLGIAAGFFAGAAPTDLTFVEDRPVVPGSAALAATRDPVRWDVLRVEAAHQAAVGGAEVGGW